MIPTGLNKDWSDRDYLYHVYNTRSYGTAQKILDGEIALLRGKVDRDNKLMKQTEQYLKNEIVECSRNKDKGKRLSDYSWRNPEALSWDGFKKGLKPKEDAYMLLRDSTGKELIDFVTNMIPDIWRESGRETEINKALKELSMFLYNIGHNQDLIEKKKARLKSITKYAADETWKPTPIQNKST